MLESTGCKHMKALFKSFPEHSYFLKFGYSRAWLCSFEHDNKSQTVSKWLFIRLWANTMAGEKIFKGIFFCAFLRHVREYIGPF